MNEAENYYSKHRSEIINFLPQKYSKILEIGCGNGCFAEHLAMPCEYWGIEPVAEAATEASSKVFKIINGKYEEVYDQIPNRYFDLVICNDVIEHMKDHDYFFESIKTKITPEAYIVGSVPNFRYIHNLYKIIIKKDWMYENEGILDRTHLRFFTEKSLKRSLVEHQFCLDKFAGINSIFDGKANIKQRIKRIVFKLLNTIFIGMVSDTIFLQYGFRVKKNHYQQ